MEQDIRPPPALSLVGDGWRVPREPVQVSRGSQQSFALLFSSPKQEGKDSLSLPVPLPVVQPPLLATPGCPVGAATISGLSPNRLHL